MICRFRFHFSCLAKGNIFLLIFQIILEGKKIGHDDEIGVFGVSIVCMKTNNNSRLVLNNIKHDPDIRLKLIYVGNLDEEDYYNILGGSQ